VLGAAGAGGTCGVAPRARGMTGTSRRTAPRAGPSAQGPGGRSVAARRRLWRPGRGARGPLARRGVARRAEARPRGAAGGDPRRIAVAAARRAELRTRTLLGLRLTVRDNSAGKFVVRHQRVVDAQRDPARISVATILADICNRKDDGLLARLMLGHRVQGIAS